MGAVMAPGRVCGACAVCDCGVPHTQPPITLYFSKKGAKPTHTERNEGRTAGGASESAASARSLGAAPAGAAAAAGAAVRSPSLESPSLPSLSLSAPAAPRFGLDVPCFA